jgi:hypothetical protein
LAIWYSSDYESNDSGGLNSKDEGISADTSTNKINNVEEINNTSLVKDSNKVICDTFPVNEIFSQNKLNSVERRKLINDPSTIKGLMSIQLNNNGDTVFIKAALSNKDALGIIKNLLKEKLKIKKEVSRPPGNNSNNNKSTNKGNGPPLK